MFTRWWFHLLSPIHEHNCWCAMLTMSSYCLCAFSIIQWSFVVSILILLWFILLHKLTHIFSMLTHCILSPIDHWRHIFSVSFSSFHLLPVPSLPMYSYVDMYILHSWIMIHIMPWLISWLMFFIRTCWRISITTVVTMNTVLDNYT